MTKLPGAAASWPPGTLLLAATLPLAACETAEDTSTGAPQWTVGAEPVSVYGSAGDDLETGFGYVADVARGPDGTIAVADGLLNSLSFFSAEGELLARAGRTGEGPGEFSEIAGLVSTPDGRLFVFDRGLQRLSEWTFGGGHAGDTRLARQGAYRPIGEVGLFEDGGWYAREEDQFVAVDSDGKGRDTVGFHALRGGEVGQRLAQAPGTITASFEMMGPGMREALLSPRAVGVARGTCLLVGATDNPVLGVVDAAGNRVGEVRLDVEVENATRQHRDDWLAGALATAEVELGPDERTMLERLATAVPMADRVPYGSDVMVDDLGYIWVERYQLPDGYPSSNWRVFTETGAAAGAVVLPEGFRPGEISADAILGVFTHEMGVEDVRVYALDRGGDAERRPAVPGCG